MAGDRLPPGPIAGAAGERLTSEERLRRRKDYLRCYRTGRRRHGSLAILYFVPNQLGHPRIGITASRKVGKAVVRHRLKRRIKEVYRRWQDRGSLPALDLVVHLKPEAGKSDFPALRAELLRLFGGLRERRERREVTRLLVYLLGVYKRRLSPLLPRSCRFTPTCSEYARLAILKHGPWRGGFLTAGRLMRCQPFHPGGLDLP